MVTPWMSEDGRISVATTLKKRTLIETATTCGPTEEFLGHDRSVICPQNLTESFFFDDFNLYSHQYVYWMTLQDRDFKRLGAEYDIQPVILLKIALLPSSLYRHVFHTPFVDFCFNQLNFNIRPFFVANTYFYFYSIFLTRILISVPFAFEDH